VGQSRAIAGLIRRIDLVAASRSTVLITGETGTGKELVARAVHDRSAQQDMPFIKVNCAAIPETLLESELFGHVRGAFTDAGGARKGKFALAHRGTIFLDEIASMSGGLQAKLLRVLQEREFEPLGAERTEQVDVRVIAATNRDLRQLVGEGRFQDDLFYRLHVIPIAVPPLRERLEDIPVLVEHFVDKHATRMGTSIGALVLSVKMRRPARMSVPPPPYSSTAVCANTLPRCSQGRITDIQNSVTIGIRRIVICRPPACPVGGDAVASGNKITSGNQLSVESC
jgi:transcriptional regulator with GAF, ATPase, and Fis domain